MPRPKQMLWIAAIAVVAVGGVNMLSFDNPVRRFLNGQV